MHGQKKNNRFFRDFPKYLNSAILSKKLLRILIMLFCPAICSPGKSTASFEQRLQINIRRLSDNITPKGYIRPFPLFT